MANTQNEITKINANELEVIANPERGESIIMVDRDTNKGLQIDYNSLAAAIIKQVLQDEIGNDGLRVVVVDDE